jgi:hypothetical protein
VAFSSNSKWLGSALDGLVALGWLHAHKRYDADAVRAAIIWLAGRALALELRPR